MEIQLDIFGSYVSRDVIRFVDTEVYKVNRCIGAVPISSLYEAPAKIDEDVLEQMPISQYEKRMFRIQSRRNAVNLLKKSEGKILILDLASECLNRCLIGENNNQSMAYVDGMEEYLENLLVNPEDQHIIETVSPLEMDMKQIEKKYKKFAYDILKSKDNPTGYNERNIIVIEVYYAEKYVGTKDGILHSQPAEYQVHKVNAWLKKMYQLIYKNIPDCQVIKLPIFTYSTENHIRGKGPLCYTDATYQYIANVLGVLCGVQKLNSADNLYNEQGLKNKLFTRLLNASSINSIAGMKKDIAALKKQVEQLKKELAEMKKR